MRRTSAARTTVNQELREILPAEPVRRRVQILTPPSPTVFIGIDTTPEVVGYDRGPYKLPQLPVNYPIKFWLESGQNLIACASVGYAVLSVLVDYPDGD